MIYRDPILDDEEIKVLIKLYDYSPSRKKALFVQDLQRKIGKTIWDETFPRLEAEGFTERFHASRDGKQLESKVFINFKGKFILYDVKNRQQTLAIAVIAAVVSVIVGSVAIWGIWVDYKGDQVWRAQQLEQLEMINENLQTLNQLQNKKE